MIGNKPATYRAPVCTYCGHVTDDTSVRVGGYAHIVCEDCDLANTFSDAYKDVYGVRPHFPVDAAYMRNFVRNLYK